MRRETGRDRPAQHVFCNGRVTPLSEARLSVFDRGLLYGESAFETVKVVEGVPCLWEPHGRRLQAACAGLHLLGEEGWETTRAELEQGIRRLLQIHPVERGALRVQITGGDNPGGARGLAVSARERSPSVVAAVQEAPAPPESLYQEGVSVISASSDLCRTLPYFKSGNHLASVEARRRAAECGAFECLLTRGRLPAGGAAQDEDGAEKGAAQEGATGEAVRLLEGSFTSLIGWDGEQLLFPAEEGSLPGVTRSVLRSVAEEEGIPAVDLGKRDGPPGLGYPVSVYSGSGNSQNGIGYGDAGPPRTPGLLLTSSLLGVCACSHLDGVPLVSGAGVAEILRSGLRLREEASQRGWLAGG